MKTFSLLLTACLMTRIIADDNAPPTQTPEISSIHSADIENLFHNNDGQDSKLYIKPEAQATPPQPRELGQIVVEEEHKVKKTQKRKSKKSQSFKAKKLVSKLGLSTPTNAKKFKRYFRKLERQMYRSFKKALKTNKKYMEQYQDVLAEYKRLSEKYNIDSK